MFCFIWWVVYLHVCLCTKYTCLVTMEARRRPCLPSNWACGHLWAAIWVLRTEPRSSGKAARTEPSLQTLNSSFCSNFFFHVAIFIWAFLGSGPEFHLSLCLRDRWLSQKHGGWSINGYKRGVQRGDTGTSGLFIPMRREVMKGSPWQGGDSVCSRLFTRSYPTSGIIW